MARELFGTDGIRGVAGEYPLDARTVFAFGLALGRWAARHGAHPEVLLGMDTRESGPELAELVAGGLAQSGALVHSAGVITTPGVAHLTRTGRFVAGVMISASHNQYRDNGLKVFDHSGHKLPDEEEHALEQEILRWRADGPSPEPFPAASEPALDETYLEHLASTSGRLDGFSVTLDCGNGAAFRLAPELFRRLGARVDPLHCSPDGRNINLECGALHVEPLRRRTVEAGSALGVAFDGDADRAIFVSASGRVIDGDAVMLVCGRSLHRRGGLSGSDGRPLVVATVMSNLGLELALAAEGILMLRTPVGDRYVIEEMRRRGAALGGEQSGHVIFREFSTTGDGLLTALRVLAAMREAGRGLDELAADLEVFPQKLVNIRVREKRPLEDLPAVRREIRAAEAAFGGSGRVLVRYSGTEALARVMVEAADAGLVEEFARRISEAVRTDLGAPPD